jgi:RecA/RadA recombinase
MPAALTLKIKQALNSPPAALPKIDAVLGGGIPRRSITEVSGAVSTGKKGLRQ